MVHIQVLLTFIHQLQGPKVSDLKRSPSKVLLTNSMILFKVFKEKKNNVSPGRSMANVLS